MVEYNVASSLQKCAWPVFNEMRLKHLFCDVILVPMDTNGLDTNHHESNAGEREQKNGENEETNEKTNNQLANEGSSCPVEAHQLVLCASSPFFRSKFQDSDFHKDASTRIQVPSAFTEATVRTIVEYVYTGTITLNCQNVRQLFAASSALQLELLTTLIIDFMVDHWLDVDNCVRVYHFALQSRTRLSKLEQSALQMIATNLDRVPCRKRLLCLDVEQFVHLIQAIRPEVIVENKMFSIIEHWLTHDPEHRREHVQKLALDHVHFDRLTIDFLVDHVVDNKLFDGNSSLQKKLNQTLKNKLSINIEAKPVAKFYFSSMKSSALEKTKTEAPPKIDSKTILVVGGTDQSSYCELLHPFTKQRARTLKGTEQRRHGHGLAAITIAGQRRVLALGGFGYRSDCQLLNVDQIMDDDFKPLWTSIKPMCVGRQFFGTSSRRIRNSKGQLCILGGEGEQIQTKKARLCL